MKISDIFRVIVNYFRASEIICILSLRNIVFLLVFPMTSHWLIFRRQIKARLSRFRAFSDIFGHFRTFSGIFIVYEHRVPAKNDLGYRSGFEFRASGSLRVVIFYNFRVSGSSGNTFSGRIIGYPCTP